MTFCFMSNSQSDGQTLRCPVCHARQPFQHQCRRCGADLTLLVKAKRRVAYLIDQRDAADQAHDQIRVDRLQKELQQLQSQVVP